MSDSSPLAWWRRHARRLLPPLVVVVVATLVVVWMMHSTTGARRAKPAARAARLVEVTAVAPSNPRLTVEAWGTVQAAREVTLQSQVAGEVQRIGPGLEPGARVAQGALLLQVDPADYRLAVRQRRADLTKARADLALEQGKQAVAKHEFDLLAREADPSAEQKRLMLRGPQRESARAAVATAEAALAAAQLNLQRTRVTAPFNALVLERFVNRGTRLTAGAQIATLAGTDAFWVELAVPAASLKWISVPAAGVAQTGSDVRLYHDQVWGAGHYREGRVIRLRGDLDAKGRMARLLVTVPDPLDLAGKGRPRLLLGAFVRAEIAGRQLHGVRVLERRWLRDGDVVWAMDRDGRLALRHPEVVYRGARRVYLRGGLKPGDRIVTSDLAVAVAGMPLRTADAPAARPAP